MMGKFLPLLASSLVIAAVSHGAQAASSTFDDLALSANSYYFPAADASFSSGEASFFHDYDARFGSWSGWTYSSKTDTTTPGYGNQYSAYAGSGQGGSANYGVAFVPYTGPLQAGLSTASVVTGAYFTNTTYTALTMLHGDAFSKKFGGASGNDADFFKLTITGYNGAAGTGAVDFFLADYRFADNAQDYIVKDWTLVDLSGLGRVTRLEFALDSSDAGQFGVNTPLYLAMDNLTTAPVPEPEQAALLLAGLALLGGVARSRAAKRNA